MRKFDKNDLINEILDIKEFYESTDFIKGAKFAYRVKSILKKIDVLTIGYIYICISMKK
ncbi:hypothetical protein [Clostridium cochlearium]|uniref:hypothetical protein n=1 Tax=Clostridium cochlearium TaxID=1494 RepID=UPI0012FDBE55|nr:hypothetical protein [Clostridium cochlearium]MBU5270514.1 hypothetical protein [Clostridium cochlearium]